MINLIQSPWVIIAASVLALIAGSWLKKNLRPWLQKRQDGKNAREAEEHSRRSQTENQKANEEISKW